MLCTSKSKHKPTNGNKKKNLSKSSQCFKNKQKETKFLLRTKTANRDLKKKKRTLKKQKEKPKTLIN